MSVPPRPVAEFPVERRRIWAIVAVAVPLALAVAGLVHPMDLTPDTAGHWTTIHLVLLPVFPLLGLAPWLTIAGARPALRLVVALLVYVYAVFYSALDVLAGVGTGRLVGSGVEAAAVRLLFTAGNQLSQVGVVAFLLATLLAGGYQLACHRVRAVPGVGLSLAAAISFLTSHIYWPRGVVTMLVLAVGWALLFRLGSARRTGAAQPPLA